MIGEVLALDYDDCFQPMMPRFLDLVHQETGKRLSVDDAVPGVFPFHEAFPDSGISSDQFTELVDQYMLEYSLDGDPFPDAVDAVMRLSVICDVHIVTARPTVYEDVTLASIEKNRILDSLKGVHVMGANKGELKTEKTDTYEKIGADSVADDADHNINSAIKLGLIAFSVQYPGYRHNGYNLDDNAIVVKSLSDILRYASMPNR